MNTELRKHLLELLKGRSAHIHLATAIKSFPINEIDTRVEHSPHTAWELLEHARIAQWDILEFCRNPKHVSPEFPAGYWNPEIGTAEDWRRSSEQVFADLESMCDLVADETLDLFAEIPHGTGKTLLREVLLVADHNAYHAGQMMLLHRMIEADGHHV